MPILTQFKVHVAILIYNTVPHGLGMCCYHMNGIIDKSLDRTLNGNRSQIIQYRFESQCYMEVNKECAAI
jgi:hypothetical protein